MAEAIFSWEMALWCIFGHLLCGDDAPVFRPFDDVALARA